MPDYSNFEKYIDTPDGRVISPHSGTYDNLELALEALKNERKQLGRKLQNAG